MGKRHLLAAAVAAIIGSAAASANATTTASTTFNVNATIANSCVVSATDLAFGTYDTTATSATTSTSTITVNCTTGTAYHVGLDAGGGSGATVSARAMTGTTHTSSTLGYALYTDSGHSTNWGNTVSTDTVDKTATATPDALTVYGRIPAGENVVADTYQDTINVTVTY